MVIYLYDPTETEKGEAIKMSDYVLTTSSPADLTNDYFTKINVPYVSLHYDLGNATHADDL